MLRSSFATFAIRGFAAGATFVMHLLIARLLGASGTGLFFLSLAIMRGGVEVGRFGQHQSIIRFVAPLLDQGDRPAAARFVAAGTVTTFWISLATSAAICLACLTVMPALFPERQDVWTLTAVFSWAAVPLSVSCIQAGVAQAFGRPAMASVLEVALVPAVASLGFLAVALATEPSLDALVWIYMAASAGVTVYGWLLVRRWLAERGRMRRAEAGELLRVGSSLLVVNGARYVVQNAPLLILGMIAVLDDAGVFSVAHRLSLAVSILLTAVNNVMFARFAVAWRKGERDRLEQELQSSALLLIAMGLPVILILAVFRTEILGLLGDDFERGGMLLLILLAGQLVNLLTASTSAVLAMTGNERALRRNSLISGATSLVVSLVLIPIWGDVGAAIAISAAIAIQNGMAAWQAWTLVGMRVVSLSMFRRRK